MSINVTVSGNPISIKRGKMVTTDPNHAKKEFEKRRLIRLEQVRQQSKDIAENIRNKVRNEKMKQLSKIEEEGKQKLKNWQNRKLFDLQTQYKEALKEFGTGHKQAEELQDELELMAEQKEYTDELANRRGRVAATKLQIEKNTENFKKSIPIQQKKFVRDIENTRAALVSSIKNKKKDIGDSNKTKKKRKASADINITIPDSDSDSEESEVLNVDMPGQGRLSNIGEDEEPSQSSCECTEDSEVPRTPLDLDEKNAHTKVPFQEPSKEFEPMATRSRYFAPEIDSRKIAAKHIHERSTRSPPPDTRISDRIKRREIMASQPDYCDTVAETHPIPMIQSNCQIRNTINSRNICPCQSTQRARSPLYGQDDEKSQDEIPTKPPIKLKDKGSTLESDSQKVQFYDHPNRFSQEKFPSKTHVEKITSDSLEVIPNVISEAEWYEKMKQRDKEAQLRGQRALEKERIQKDYEDMLKKLPVLKKKERICEITKDKEEYHMSDERLKEKERRKQNELDNAYSTFFPDMEPAVVTLPSKKHEERERKLPQTDSIQSLNVGNWDVDHEEPKMFTIEEVQEIVRAFTGQKPKDRQAKLKELLKSLKLQKQQLINEIRSLPKDDSINELINDLNSVSDNDDTGPRKKDKRRDKSQRKRQREENENSTDSTTESSSTTDPKNDKEKRTKDKHKGHRDSAKTPSPRKKVKIKSRRKVLILQNTSTQTTPKVSVNSSEDNSKEQIKTKPICEKTHVPCDCNKENESSVDELCKIVIKLNDNEDPEVVVNPKETAIAEKDKKIREKSPSPKRSPITKKTESKSVAVGTDKVQDKPKTKERMDDGRISTKVSRSDVDKPRRTASKDKSEAKLVSGSKKDKIMQTESSDARSKSWREHLSKNSFSTSSTSYMSPPDFQKATESQPFGSYHETSRQSFYNLHKKPQQSNLDELSTMLSFSHSQSSLGEGVVDPRLLIYIQKLLSMSRGSIENLTVSTSSVQTPSQSIVEIESNNPMAQLHNIIKYINIRADDIARELSYSSDSTPVQCTSKSCVTEVTKQQVMPEKNPDIAADQAGKPVPFSIPFSISSSSIADKETSTCSGRSKESVLAQFADITDSCSKRIATLAAMIQQIREEKLQMLQNPPGTEVLEKSDIDKERSTAYLDLPDSKESSKHSSVESMDDDELQRKLLEIDLSLANKLRKFTPAPRNIGGVSQMAQAGSMASSVENIINDTDRELRLRLQRLMQNDRPPATTETTLETRAFVPFLSDIPKLPKLEPQPETFRPDMNSSFHKRPPPSKGLTIAKKFNGNISTIPHELSTIIEADSQLSTKVSSSHVSPNASKTSQNISPRKNFELVVQPEPEVHSSGSSKLSRSDGNVPANLTKISVTSKKRDDLYTQTSDLEISLEKAVSTTPSPVNISSDTNSSRSIILTTTASKKAARKLSTSSNDDLEALEAMLRSIGMEWAIPTLHKTHEALALTSSSSSLDMTSKKKTIKNDSSGSEISLKQFLSKQIKISSSTLRSDASPDSADFSEISAIQTSSSSTEKVKRRTSTPITSSKGSNKSKSDGRKVAFSAGSDISSVREDSDRHSDKHSFGSLSAYSQSKNDE